MVVEMSGSRQHRGSIDKASFMVHLLIHFIDTSFTFHSFHPLHSYHFFPIFHFISYHFISFYFIHSMCMI